MESRFDMHCEKVTMLSKLCRCNESEPSASLKILNEFHKMYEEKLNSAAKHGTGDVLEHQNQILMNWVNDLIEQNALLVKAVEELEAEATERICSLEQKMCAERAKHVEVEQELHAETRELRQLAGRRDSDVRGLLELLRRLRDLDYWSLDGIHFFEVTERDIFGESDWHEQLGDVELSKSQMNCDNMKKHFHKLCKHLEK